MVCDVLVSVCNYKADLQEIQLLTGAALARKSMPQLRAARLAYDLCCADARYLPAFAAG